MTNINEPVSNKLFELPEYVNEFGKFTYKSINELVWKKDPVLSQISVVEAEEIPTTQYSLPSGETLELQPIAAAGTANIQTEDLLSSDLSSYYVSIDAAAESILPQVREQFYNHVGTVCDAYGNSVSAEGQPISHELMLQVYEKKDLNFDENGNIAEGEMIVLSASMAEQLRKLPPMTAEQEQAWNEMIERKRQEFYARKRNRKLS